MATPADYALGSMRSLAHAPFLASVCALGVLTLGGCTTSVAASGEQADAEVSPAATGIIVVEGSSSNEGSRSEAVARFVRARAGAVDDDTLRMVGATFEFPALGSCEALGAARGPSTVSAITLVDVGSVAIMAGEATTTLQARQVPDVADLVSGVVYSARADELPSKSGYVLRVDGSADLGVAAFVVSATSPGEPNELRLAHDDGHAGAVAILAAAPSVDVSWDPGSGDDAIYVDISATNRAPTTRCLFDDSGHATLPASAFGAIDDGTVSVHRLHREPFHARGVEPGEVRFDFARVVAFSRR
jgi:hypothetical protein